MPDRPLPREHQRLAFGWAVEVGVVLVFVSPVLWAVSAALDWPVAVRCTFMWLTVVLAVAALASMVALPFIRRRDRRAWQGFTPPTGLTHSASDDAAAADLAGFPMSPFDLTGPAQSSASNLLRTSYGAVAVWTFTYGRREARQPRSTYQILVAALPRPLPFLSVRVPMEAMGPLGRGHRVQIEYGAFNHRYAIATYDSSSAARKYAVDVLHPRAVEGLMAYEPVDFTIYGRRAVMTSLFPGNPAHAQKLLATYGRALARLVELIPRHVYDDQAGNDSRPRGLLE